MTTLNDAFQRELTQDDEGYESGSKSLGIPTPLRRAPWIYQVSTSENLPFDPTASLVRTSDPHLQHHRTPDNSPLQGRAEPLSPVQYHMDYHHTSTPITDDSFLDATAEEDFPTVPLGDDIWLEDPDRHLCIHEQSQPHFWCCCPCPYSLGLPHSSAEDAPALYYEMMDLSDMSGLQDVMTTTSYEDIPDLEDIFGL